MLVFSSLAYVAYLVLVILFQENSYSFVICSINISFVILLGKIISHVWFFSDTLDIAIVPVGNQV